MNEEWNKKLSEWMQMEKKTPEQRKRADEFYESNLMDLNVDDYARRNKEKVLEGVDYLVISVGTSYEPIIMNIKLLQPRRILFLYTEKTGSILGKIVKYCGLEPEDYEKSRVNENDPLAIYQEIKQIYLKWNKPDKMYIDFSGGTKIMSVAAAMAGTMIDAKLVYVGTNDYMEDMRKPNPGSESLLYITNPLAVFGDLEIEKALDLFGEHNYAGAKEKLSVLKEDIPDANIRQELNFVYLLAKVYEAWEALDFAAAYENMKQLNRQLERDYTLHKVFSLMDFYAIGDILKQQEQILAHLQKISILINDKENKGKKSEAEKNMAILQEKDLITALMFTMCQNGLVREKQEKYDMSTLMFYRLLELIEQRRLSRYGLYVSKMNYEDVQYDINQCPAYNNLSVEEQQSVLKEKVRVIEKKLFKQPGNDYLPEKVSLLKGFTILQALGDPIVCSGKPGDVNRLQKINGKVILRNKSIFAHGLAPVNGEKFIEFKNFVMDIFCEFCKIEEIDFDVYLKQIHWLEIKKLSNLDGGSLRWQFYM